MGILILLIIASLIVAIFFLVAFVVSVRSGQFDDTYSPAQRILFDDVRKQKPPASKKA